MKPKAPIPPKPKMSEEERKEQMTRAFLQKRASLAEGILFNLCQKNEDYTDIDKDCGYLTCGQVH